MKINTVTQQFRIAGGSVIGSDHAMLGQPISKNNQDSFHWLHGRNCTFAVVCDGCSSGPYSEVGAQLISRILSKIVVSLADDMLDENPSASFADYAPFWKRVEEFLLNDVLSITRMIGSGVSQTINDFWLCTIIGTLITPYSTYIVAVGDGVYTVNGEIYFLTPEEGNSPTYIAYQISGTTLAITDPDALSLRVRNAFDTESVETIILASDGVEDLMEHAEIDLPGKAGKAGKVGSIHQFSDEKFFRNPDNVRRRLALMGLETISGNYFVSSFLKDDTTLITIKRHQDSKNPNSE